MQKTLGELAGLVDGVLHGDADIVILGIATVANAGPEDITLAENSQFLDQLESSSAAAILVPPGVEPKDISYIVVDNVRDAIAKIISQFRKSLESTSTGISTHAHISATARIAEHVDIHPGAIIGDDVEIGSGSSIYSGAHVMAGSKLAEDVILFPNVVLYEHTLVGPRVVIHSGTVVGAYGFGYELDDNRYVRSPQLGYVEIQGDVEIGAGTTIDRGTYDATVIGAGTKIDNQVMIAHNCRVGRHNIICSQVGLAGSVTTGDYCVFAGQVGIKDHVNIGHRAKLAAKSGVMKDVPNDAVFIGVPATDAKEQRQIVVAQARLPKLLKQLKQLKREVEWLNQQMKSDRPNEAA